MNVILLKQFSIKQMIAIMKTIIQQVSAMVHVSQLEYIQQLYDIKTQRISLYKFYQ